jgi:ssDNA-binding Zn-finger/Zn-ribbon topoisomerase 1
MGIKCSLLGHSFTETNVEEEREEQGSEVVITIKETETCERCGKSRVVSENKEVTAIESSGEPDETGPEPATEPEPAAGPGPAADPEPEGPSEATPAPDIDAAEDDAELLEDDDAEPATDSTVGAEPASAETADAETAAEAIEEAPEPETGTDRGETVTQEDTPEDDAVILDDGDEDDREPGEWPEEEESDDQSIEQDWPEDDQNDEQTVEDEWPEETLADEPTGDEEVPEWPEEDRGEDDDWTPTENLTDRIERTEIEPAGSATVTVPEGDFECPECGFTTSVESTSLRAGDFCPECHRGALEHRAGAETRKE